MFLAQMLHPEVLDKRGKDIFRSLAAFRDTFYLAGGTALALQIGHRISVDFDLFTESKLSLGTFGKAKEVFQGETISPSVNNSEELTLFVGDTKITFLEYPFPVLFPFVSSSGIPLLDKKEIAVTKAYTIGRRGSLKDYVDLYFLLSLRHTSLEEIVKLGKQKYGKEFNGRLFLEQLMYLEDVGTEELIFTGEKVTKDKLQNFFDELVSQVKL